MQTSITMYTEAICFERILAAVRNTTRNSDKKILKIIDLYKTLTDECTDPRLLMINNEVKRCRGFDLKL